MHDTHANAQADSTLRWGGWAGILGSILMLVTFGWVAAFVGLEVTPEQPLTTFPEIQTARVVEESLVLGAVLLWLIHSLGLYRALRRTSPTPALVGTALSILGLVLFAAGAFPQSFATAPLSDLYLAPGATPQDQATLELVWRGIFVVFEALLYTALLILPLGLIALGTAMFGAPGYGPRLGGTTLAFAVAGLAAAAAVLAGATTGLAAVGVFALIGFHLLLGRTTLKLVKAPRSRTAPPSRTLAGA